jgi:hypothetical protein
MSHESPGPIDADLDALLDAERGARAPAAALDRVWARMGVPGGGGAGHGGSGNGSSGGAAGNVASAGKAAARWAGSHVAGVAVAAFVAGGLAGAGVHATLVAPTPRRAVPVAVAVARVEPPSLATAPPATPLLASAAATAPARVAVAAQPPASQAAAPGQLAEALSPYPSASAPTSTLTAEQSILDDARAELTSGDPNRALALVDDHAQRFPHPHLGEEREALAIQALVAAGRYDEARARAARFRAAAPHSLFLPAIDATLASIP